MNPTLCYIKKEYFVNNSHFVKMLDGGNPDKQSHRMHLCLSLQVDNNTYLIPLRNNLGADLRVFGRIGHSIPSQKKTDGEAYTTRLTADSDGYSVTATVTMGGADVTSSAFDSNTGVVSIASVTGDIVVEAYQSGYTNILPLAKDYTDNSQIYNTVGYKEGLYASTNSISTTSADANYFVTGVLPMEISSVVCPDSLYIKGFALNTSASHCRIQAAYTNGTSFSTIYGAGQLNASRILTYFDVVTLDASSNYYRLDFKKTDGVSNWYSAMNITAKVSGIRLSAPIPSTGCESIIIAVDEPIN